MGTRCVLAMLMALALSVPAFADETPRQSRRAELLDYRQALEFLKGLPRLRAAPGEPDCKTYEDKNIHKLAQPFVMLAASFLKAFSEVHGHVTITSAHRNAAEQKCVCEHTLLPCAGWRRNKKGKLYRTSGASRHANGRALDVRAGTGTALEYRCMQEFAKKNPVFGVHFPLGMRDPPHLEPTGRWGLRAYLKLFVKTRIVFTPPVLVHCSQLEQMYEPFPGTQPEE